MMRRHDDTTIDVGSLTAELFGGREALREEVAPPDPGPEGGARWLHCSRCGSDEFTVVVPVALDVARPYLIDGRVRAADDFEVVASLQEIGAMLDSELTWTCTKCGATSGADRLATGEPFDPLVEIFDAAPGNATPLTCGRCGRDDLEIRRTTIEHVPVLLLPSPDEVPAVIEGRGPLGTHVVATVAWCRTCDAPLGPLGDGRR